MCDFGTCRQCRLEDRLLDKDMGVQRKYIQGRLPSLESNIEGRKVIGNGLVSSEHNTQASRLKPPPAPRGSGLPKAERVKLMTEERKRERDLVEVTIDGVTEMRFVSRECPCHGTYSGYLNWYCRCGHCTIAHSKHKADKRAEANSVNAQYLHAL